MDTNRPEGMAVSGGGGLMLSSVVQVLRGLLWPPITPTKPEGEDVVDVTGGGGAVLTPTNDELLLWTGSDVVAELWLLLRGDEVVYVMDDEDDKLLVALDFFS